MSSSRKRTLEVDLEDDEGHERVDLAFDFSGIARSYDLDTAKLTVTEKEAAKFDRLPIDAQKSCVKAVCRLFLFRGSRQEGVSRKHIADVLNAIHPDYKTHVNAVAAAAQSTLYDTCGYLVVSGADVKELPSAKKDVFYMSSALPSQALKQILTASKTFDSAYAGFKALVFYCILTTANNKITQKDLLHTVRKVDPRFSESLSSKGQRSAAPITELQTDFVGLIERMQKEGYITVCTDDMEPNEEGKKLVEFGPRFHTEVGRRKLLVSYFQLTNQPVDQAALRELDKEDKDKDKENTPEQTQA